MLHPLLLDAAPVTQGTPVTVYVTIGAAVLAALASLNATRVSAKTAREVATLSSRTAQESARLAAQTAQELKEKDYKNDFYKKLIEKRLAAWTEAESLGKHLARVIRDENDGEPRFAYFAKSEKFLQVLDGINDSIINQVIWIQGDYNGHLVAFRQKLLDIGNECTIKGTVTKDSYNELDAGKLWATAKRHHQELAALYVKMMASLGNQLVNLHDIEGFLKGAYNPSAPTAQPADSSA